VGEFGSPHTGAVTHLFARRQGEAWVVDEGKAGATWSLESRGDDRVGTWRAADGHRTAPVLLSCLEREDGKAVDVPAALLLGGGAPARQLARLLRRGLTVETDVAVGSARYRNAVDVMLGRTYLQLTTLDPQRPPRPALLRELNERIRQHVAKAVQEEKTGREQFPDCEIESSVEIKFASSRFLTLSTFDEWSCGNPHSEQNTTLETFDVSGERAVEVALGEAYQTTRDARTKRAFWRVISAARGSTAGAAKCVEDEAMGAHYELGVVQGGVLVDVDFGTYAADPCDFSVVLPARALQRFAVSLRVARRRGRR
jgi:hypothetical protein